MEASSRFAGSWWWSSVCVVRPIRRSIAARGQLAALEARAKLGERGGFLGDARRDEFGDGVAAVRRGRVERLLRGRGVRFFFVQRRAAGLERLAASLRAGGRRGSDGRWLRGRGDGVRWKSRRRGRRLGRR